MVFLFFQHHQQMVLPLIWTLTNRALLETASRHSGVVAQSPPDRANITPPITRLPMACPSVKSPIVPCNPCKPSQKDQITPPKGPAGCGSKKGTARNLRIVRYPPVPCLCGYRGTSGENDLVWARLTQI